MDLNNRTISPAIMGIPSISHGAKLRANMNPQDKNNLLLQLEEWRKSRSVKLRAAILAKGKQLEKGKSTIPPRPSLKTTVIPTTSTSSSSNATSKISASEGKKSVFDRLYEGGKNPARKLTEESKIDRNNMVKKPLNLKVVKKTFEKKVEVPKIVISEVTENDLEESVTVTVGSPVKTDEEKIEIESITVNAEEETSCPESDQVTEVTDLQHEFPCEVLEEIKTMGENEEEVNDEVDNLNGKNEVAEEIEQVCDLKLENEVEECVEKELKKEIGEKDENLPVVVSNKWIVTDANEEELLQSKEKTTKVVKKNGNKTSKTKEVQPRVVVSVKTKPKIRRSISSMYRSKSGKISDAIHRKKPEENLESVTEEQAEKAAPLNEINESNEDDKKEKSILKRSVCFVTPKTKNPSAVHLRDKLETWLMEQGKSIDSYSHLRCFDLHTHTPGTPYHHKRKGDEFDSPTVKNECNGEESDKENMTPPVFAPKYDVKTVEGWLTDLLKLIVDLKYPKDRCEEWLAVISRKFPSFKQLPIYWECMVAVYGDEIDIKPNAVDAEDGSKDDDADFVDNTLAELLDKLVLDEKNRSASKSDAKDKGIDRKNIFRSTTMKFKLQEKLVKHLDPTQKKDTRQKVLVATPVRRSARFQTPDKSNVVGSLKNLDPDVFFQPNDALLTD